MLIRVSSDRSHGFRDLVLVGYPALYQYETRPISSNVTIAVAVSQGMSLRSNGVMAANRVVGHPLSVLQGAYQTTLV